MTGSVIRKTSRELHEQRARLIASTGLTEAVLRERGEAFQRYPEHMRAWETVQGLDHLLDGTEPMEEVPEELERLRAEIRELYSEIEAAQAGLSDMAKKRNAEMDRANRFEAALQRVLVLHECREKGENAYCYLCSDHGDISWPCKTVKAIEGK